MDGTVAPHRAILDILDIMNEASRPATPHLVVDEVRAMGLCVPVCLCMIALLWLEDRMLARLHTFGKARAALSGASLFYMPVNFSGPPSVHLFFHEPL